MNLDSKQKVLFAIYLEYQKDLPNISIKIKSENIGLDEKVFDMAMKKLENEKLITGTLFSVNGTAILYNTMMTREGIDYVEGKFNISNTESGKEKLEELSKKSVSWVWNEAKDIISRTLSEIIQANTQNQ